MKGIITFVYEDEYNFLNHTLDLDNEYGYCITIKEPPDSKIDNITSIANDLNNSISNMINIWNDAKEKKLFAKLKGHELELLKNAKYIQFYFNPEDIEKCIKANPFLCKKKIILSEIFDLKNLKDIQKIFDGKTDNLYFSLSGNYHLINFQECFDTYKILEGFTNHINCLELSSPIEKIMYTYDIVRNKIYAEVDKNDDKLKSRELSSALLGDKIVCVGYSIIFQAILNKLNIDSRECYLIQENNKNHAINETYLKDDKYGINGIYYFDTTWDSRKNPTDNSYLLSYKYFAKTRNQINQLENNTYTDEFLPYFSDIICGKSENIVQNEGFDKVPDEMIKTINAMSNKITGKPLIDSLYTIPTSPHYGEINLEKITNDLNNIINYYDRPLSANTLLQVLYNVRKLEYYENPNKFQFSADDFKKIAQNSGWNFDGDFKEEIISYASKIDLCRNIKQIKLTRVLRNVYESKKITDDNLPN